jgi:hypothetical protein
MGSSLSNKKNNRKTASTQPRGGCFSLIFSPFYFILLILAIFLMANGETTQPWDLTAHPAAAQKNIADPLPLNSLNKLFTDEVLYWEENIYRWAAHWDLDPNLVATVMQIESCGDPQALSRAGAMGLFQVMPYHFTETEAPYNPETNSLRGMAYLRQALDTYHSVRLGLASYNGGIGTAAKPESNWPNETIRYVYWGLNIYQDTVEGKTSSPTLDEWLASGGASLCAQARQRLGLTP